VVRRLLLRGGTSGVEVTVLEGTHAWATPYRLGKSIKPGLEVGLGSETIGLSLLRADNTCGPPISPKPEITVQHEGLRRYYADLPDGPLRDALAHGPAGYASPAIWQIIAEEAESRGIELPGSPAEGGGMVPDDTVTFGDLPGEGTRYAVLAHPDGRRVAVKRGFAWPAFFFTWIWAFARGLPEWGMGLLFAVFVLRALAYTEEPLLVALAMVGGVSLRCMTAAKGNAAREHVLLAKRWVLLGTLTAATPEEALARAADTSPAAAEPSNPTWRSSGSGIPAA